VTARFEIEQDVSQFRWAVTCDGYHSARGAWWCDTEEEARQDAVEFARFFQLATIRFGWDT